MPRIEKTVFISYRRTNVPWALAIYQDLTQHGYDVFFDYEGIASGDFERAILENIRARAHFLVLLTPSALERCASPDDWLRREIETTLETKRNIVPLTLEGFDFGAPAIASQLTGKLGALKAYNALSVPPAYFAEAMERLRDKYLSVALDAVLHPASGDAKRAVTAQQAAATAAPAVKEKELSAQEWFERGFKAVGPDEQIRCYTEAIRLKPDYADAYYNRGLARDAQGDLAGAIKDYTEATHSSPTSPKPTTTGALRAMPKATWPALSRTTLKRSVSSQTMLKPTTTGALPLMPKATRLAPSRTTPKRPASSPTSPKPTTTRALRAHAQGDLAGAIQDYTAAIRLNPDYAEAYNNRGTARLCPRRPRWRHRGLHRSDPPQARLRRSLLQPGLCARCPRRPGRRH